LQGFDHGMITFCTVATGLRPVVCRDAALFRKRLVEPWLQRFLGLNLALSITDFQPDWKV
jgi:hypothetical protein